VSSASSDSSAVRIHLLGHTLLGSFPWQRCFSEYDGTAGRWGQTVSVAEVRRIVSLRVHVLSAG